MGRFYENRIFAFALNAQLTKSEVEVLLLDQNKQPLLKLSNQNPTQSILSAVEVSQCLRGMRTALVKTTAYGDRHHYTLFYWIEVTKYGDRDKTTDPSPLSGG